MNDIEMAYMAIAFLAQCWCRWRHKKRHDWRSGAYRPEIKKVVEIYYCAKCKSEVPKVSEPKFKPERDVVPASPWGPLDAQRVRTKAPLPDDEWPEIIE